MLQALERASPSQLFSRRYCTFGFARFLRVVRLGVVGGWMGESWTNQFGFVGGNALDRYEEE